MQNGSVSAQEKAQALATLARKLEAEYVFPGVARQLAAALRQDVTAGTYSSSESGVAFSDSVTKQMAGIAHDRHLRVIYSARLLERGDDTLPPATPKNSKAEDERIERIKEAWRNFDFDRVERLPGNVGYLRFSEFADPSGAATKIAAAMRFLADTDALIIDLRGNHGGNPATVGLLASYFFDAEIPVHLNDIVWRIGGTNRQSTTQSWTLPYVPGRRYLGREVYILTSHRTFSGAEEFAYDLQARKRAIVVGETTAGGANPGGVVRLSEHFQAFIPTGCSVNPVTKTNWDGRGVHPDIMVAAAAAVTTAYRLALQRELARTQANSFKRRALQSALHSLEGSRESGAAIR